MSINFTSVDRVTRNEDRLREARFWATRSIAERVMAGWSLAENDLIQPDDDDPKKRTGITLRRTSRGRR